MLRFLTLFVAAGLIVLAMPYGTRAADSPKQLQRVRGTIGYQTAADSNDFKPVFGKFELPDPDYAVTRAKSAAVIAMPDSSLISLGENTSVQVGAFNAAAAQPGSQITVNGGALRFDIRRPAGGAANYRFVTPTSQIAVRGTIGLLSFANGITTVGCVACAADSVAVTTAAGQTVTLVTGQFITVSALGAVTTGTLGTVVGAFGSAGVPVTAETGAAAAGIPAAAAGIGVPTVAGAAVAGTAIGIAASNHASPAPASTATPTPAPNVTPTPNATPTGTVNLTGHARTPAVPEAAPHPPPPIGGPAANGRIGR